MTRPLCYLALLSTTACGTGRVVPADAAPPAAEPASPAPTAAPAPTSDPRAVGAPAPGSSDAAAPYQPYETGSLPIRRIGQWSTSGIAAPAREVIRDDGAYARFWATLGAGERPAVDFTR